MLKRFARFLWKGMRPVLQAAFNAAPKQVLIVLLYFISPPLNVTSIVVRGRGGAMRGSPRDTGVLGEYLIAGDYAPKMMALLGNFFRSKGAGTFIDIGANIGFTSRPLLAQGVQCICFEPDPENFEHLSENLRDFASTGAAQLHNLAAYDRVSKISFERSDWNYGDHRVRTQESEGEYAEGRREVIQVDCVRLDDVIDPGKLRRPIVIKVDTQGAEVNVLKGGRRLLASADLLIFEFWPYGIRRQGGSEQALIEFARETFPYGNSSRNGHPPAQATFGPVGEAIEAMQETARNPAPAHIDVYLSKSPS